MWILMKYTPEFFLLIKFDFLFHRVDVNLTMVTNTVIPLSTVIKVQYYFF